MRTHIVNGSTLGKPNRGNREETICMRADRSVLWGVQQSNNT